MLHDRDDPGQSPAPPRRRQRWRSLLGLAVGVLLVHLLVLRGPGPDAPTKSHAAAPTVALATRSLVAPVAPVAVPAPEPSTAPATATATAAPRPEATRADPLTAMPQVVTARRPMATPARPSRPPRHPSSPAISDLPDAIGVAEAPPAPAATSPARTRLAPEAEAGSPAEADGAASLQAGSEVPPVYRTLLPPAAILRYEVRRQHGRGIGEIRWQPGPGTYRLQLEASLGTLALLTQSSEGRIDAAGLAPDRFVDRRSRRSAQAVNFQREAGTLAFSGPAIERPLLPGTQDRLSWMFQLAGIAAADPELVGIGRRIAMVVVGARGDASVWSLRSSGPARIETPGGWVDAIRIVRESRSGYDSGAEVWLDPARHYLPVHATQRSVRGEVEFELRLDRGKPGS